MSLPRLVLAIGALFCMGSALLGVEFSGATWTDTSQTPVAVSAAYDWTPPTVTVSDPGSSVKGSSVTIQAVASDSRSTVASVTIEFSKTGSSWTPLTACSGTDTVTCTWDTTGVPDGSYQLRATAIDAAANSGTSPLVATAVVNHVSVVLSPLPAYVHNTVPVRGDLYNEVTPGTRLTLEYRPSGGAWTQVNGSCSSTTTPLQCDWNTNAVSGGAKVVPDGTYDVRVTASTGQSDTRTGIVVDNTAPGTPTLTVPSGVLSGTISLSATVPTDSPAGLASVAIQYRLSGTSGWVTCGTGTSSPYSCALDTTTMGGNGTYEFRAVATDRADNSSASTPVTAKVDNSPATVSFTTPANGATVNGTVTVSGTAQSPRGITGLKVEYKKSTDPTFQQLCPTPVGTTFSCAWDTRSLTSGSYELRATLSQSSGGDVTTTITVNIATGSVAISSPAASATVSGSVTITGTATATGGVQKVQVTVAPVSPTTGTTSTLTCTLGSGTFSCPWNTVGLNFGTWRLTAQMTPVSGAVVTSTPVDVTVHNASIALGAVPVNLKGTSTTLTATASSNAGITAVRFEVTTATGTTTTPCPTNAPTQVNGSTYTCTWNISPITYGVYSVRAVMVQGSGLPEMASSSATTTVDNRTLGGYDVWTVNGGIANLPDGGDQIFFRYTGLVKLSTIDAGLTYGGSVPLSVSLTGDPGSHPDTMTFSNPNLGGLTLTQRYLQNNKSVTYGGSTLTAILAKDAQGNDVTVIKVTLSQISTTDFTAPTSAANTLIWTPPASVTDALGNPCLTTATPELGTADPDF